MSFQWIDPRWPSVLNDKMRELLIETSRTWKWATYRADLKHRAQAARLAKKRRKS